MQQHTIRELRGFTTIWNRLSSSRALLGLVNDYCDLWSLHRLWKRGCGYKYSICSYELHMQMPKHTRVYAHIQYHMRLQMRIHVQMVCSLHNIHIRVIIVCHTVCPASPSKITVTGVPFVVWKNSSFWRPWYYQASKLDVNHQSWKMRGDNK